MTNTQESAMRDADQKTGGNIARNLWMMLSGVGIIMLLGVITGFLSQHNAQGGGTLNFAGVAVLGAIAAASLILAFVIWKLFQQGKQRGEKVPRREKVYNRFLVGCFLLGGVTGLALSLTGSFDATETSLMSNAAMSPVLAIILSIAIGVIAPAITLYWHKHVVDEQEEAAYRFGALIAMYAFWFIAPVWWLLWRGGMLPEINGITLYFMTCFAATAVWFWKKYL
ncbi:hypothetical protein [Sphingorhabdus sp.]|jgi:hypothetical protein|uniref:hypothetical protein n=1 Tax=Sphingorhabdus sp. TaxID=1902408 RepID=UPI00404857EA